MPEHIPTTMPSPTTPTAAVRCAGRFPKWRNATSTWSGYAATMQASLTACRRRLDRSSHVICHCHLICGTATLNDAIPVIDLVSVMDVWKATGLSRKDARALISRTGLPTSIGRSPLPKFMLTPLRQSSPFTSEGARDLYRLVECVCFAPLRHPCTSHQITAQTSRGWLV